MNPGKILSAARAFLKARILKIKSPLVIGWAITGRCNRRCSYCSLWQGKSDELSTGQAIRVVDTLAEMGTLRISFTGGEPLLREDMGRIIDHVHGKGIEVKLNSNGTFVKKKIKELKNLDILALSLEGPEGVHDAIRGKGSYGEVVEAAEAARASGIKVVFAVVLTKINLDSIDFILEKAAEFGGKAVFQPATLSVLGGGTPNPIAPLKDEYRRAVDRLIERKRRGDPVIGDSIAVLRHVYNWPDPKRIKCASGWISCRIEPNGDVVYCSRRRRPSRPLNCVRDGFRKAFEALKPISCEDCWCAGRVELNICFSMRPWPLLNQLIGKR